MLQVSLTKNIHHELYYSQPTTTSTYTHLPHEDNHSLVSEEMFPPSSLPSTRNIDLQDIYLPAKHIVKSTATTNTTTTTTSSSSDRRLSRRYQPYKKNTVNNNISSSNTQTIITPPLEDMEQPLFGPVLSSNCQYSIPQPSLILDDEEVLEEFDSFISSPTRFLSSPPPSPTLSPFENDETNEDLDFNDYPLFP